MRSLLADIASGGHVATANAVDSPRALREAVLANLRELCATPHGAVLLAPDYGLEDATRIFHEYPGSVDDVRRGLESAIRRYEPRLSDVSVRHVPSEALNLLLRFEITATLVHNGRSMPVRFTSVLDPDSHVDLR